jgi:hypothetical protein
MGLLMVEEIVRGLKVHERVGNDQRDYNVEDQSNDEVYGRHDLIALTDLKLKSLRPVASLSAFDPSRV